MQNPYLAAIARHISDTPDRLFCRQIGPDHEAELSWGRLGADMGRFAAAYRDAGIAPGAVVLIFLRHVPDLYGSFFGAMAAGVTPAFMPPTSAKQDPVLYWMSHQKLLDQIHPAAIVTSRDIQAEMARSGLDLGSTRIILIEDTAPAVLDMADPDVDAIGLLQHSSGTTGLKKGVALSYRAIVAQLKAYAKTLALDADDRIVSWLPLYHDMGLIACMILPAWSGTEVTHIDPFLWVGRPGLLFDRLAKHRGTLCWLPNFAFEHLRLATARRAADYDLSHVRAFINCSEPVKAETFARFAEGLAPAGVRPEQLQCCYAMAETVFAASQTVIGETPRRIRVAADSLDRGHIPVSVEADAPGVSLLETGRVLDGLDVAFLDEDGAPVTEGAVGEIAIRGPFLFSGYNKDAARTGAALRDGFYRSRDVGFRHDGHLYVLGRLDDMIIVNGRNLYAHEVEASLAGIVGLKRGRIVAVGQSDARTGSQALIILAERTDSSAATDTAIRARIAEKLYSVFEVHPKRIGLFAAGELIKTTSGKISRSENLRRFEARQAECAQEAIA